MDPHRYANLTNAVQAVLERHIGSCDVATDPRFWDTWARTGGGAPTDAQTPTVCSEHAERLCRELGVELSELLLELERVFSSFVQSSVQTTLKQSIQAVLKPILIKNLARRFCDTCKQEINASAGGKIQ